MTIRFKKGPRIIALQDISAARRLLSLQPSQALKNGCYLAFADAEPSIVKALENLGLKAFLPHPVSKEQRDKFLRDYLKVVDVLADQNGHDIQWWATDIASKNRFASPLLRLLDIYVRCLDAIEDISGQERILVLVQLPWPVVRVLQASAYRLGVDFQVLSWPWSRSLARWRAKAEAWIALARGCIGSMLRLWEARRYFNRSFWKRFGEKPVYLIKSFVYPESFSDDNHYQDPFFGELSELFSKNLNGNIDFITVVVSFEKRDQCLKQMQSTKGNPVVPLEAFLCWYDILKGFYELLLGRLTTPFRISDEVSFWGHEIGALLKECLASGGWKISFYQYLHLAAGARISSSFKLYSCAITFEGNPWERMFVAGIKQKNAKLTILGYQHSVVPQAAAGIFVSPIEEENSPLPTSVLTTGEIPANIMRRYGKLSKIKVQPACALRYEYLYNMDCREKAPVKEGFLVLVALEGVWNVLPLLEYVFEQAPRCPDTRFRIRAHPVLPLSKLLKRLGRRMKSSSNVDVSEGGTVAGDVEDSSAVLYWGTTIALEALMMGKPLIHFDRGDFLSYDPLFEFEEFKWTVRKGQDLGSVLQEIQSISEDRRAVLSERGRKYIRSYFHEVDVSSMSKFFPGIH